MALGSTQPLVKMSTGNIPGGKGGRCVRLTTSPPSCAECHEIWQPKAPGSLWATPGRLQDSFIILIQFHTSVISLTHFFRSILIVYSTFHHDLPSDSLLRSFPAIIYSCISCLFLRNYKGNFCNFIHFTVI